LRVGKVRSFCPIPFFGSLVVRTAAVLEHFRRCERAHGEFFHGVIALYGIIHEEKRISLNIPSLPQQTALLAL
jgi:hypothetical protein